MQAIVRQPHEFKYGEDFDLFFRQFCTYAKNVKCEAAAQYSLLLSYLDNKSFRLVEGLVFTGDERTAYNADLNAALPKLKRVLTPSEEMPAKVRLRFRKQGATESLGDFGYAIQGLGISAFGAEGVNCGQVLDAFCLGVKSAELSAKLLARDFDTLQATMGFAQEHESTANIKEFVVQHRAGASGATRNADVSILQAEDEYVLSNSSNSDTAFVMSQGNPNYVDRGQGAGARGSGGYNEFAGNGFGPGNGSYGRGTGNKFGNYGRGHGIGNDFVPSGNSNYRHGAGNYKPTDGQNRSHDNSRNGYVQGGYYKRHDDYTSRNSDVQCFKCNGWGHYSKACISKKEARTCHYCLKIGHLVKSCYKKANDEKYGTQNVGSGNQQAQRGAHAGQNFRGRPGN